MYHQAHGEIRWNIFARELEDLLQARGSRLGMLDNHMLDDDVLVHRAQVARLQQSLKSAKSFPLLNPRDIERIKTYFKQVGKPFNEYEEERLRLAIIATSVERTLMNWVSAEDAYHAAEALFQALLHPAEVEEFARFTLEVLRGGEGASAMQPAEAEQPELADASEPVLGPALDMLDRAVSALHLGLDARTTAEQITLLRQARERFELTLKTLDQAHPGMQAHELWQYWREEAASGLEKTRERLAKLEG